ncbi:HAD family hydrolase [Candidatus Margulisiibacteriota bacterium]
MLKTIVFDFDGVILESADIKTKAFKKIFEEEYPEQADKLVEYHLKHAGISRFTKFRYFYEKILKLPYTKDIENKLGEKFKNTVLNDILNCSFVPGALEFLRSFSGKFLFFIASGSEEQELKYIISKRHILSYFKEIHGGHRKKTAIIEDIISRYDLKKEEILFVGDADSDRKAADLSRIHFVAVITGTESTLNDCTYKISSLHELNKVIDQINNKQ